VSELRKRSLVKALIWRIIGIAWTWLGAWLIVLMVPEPFNSAAWIATFVTIYHHATRLVMYYFYERIWGTIAWGKMG